MFQYRSSFVISLERITYTLYTFFSNFVFENFFLVLYRRARCPISHESKRLDAMSSCLRLRCADESIAANACKYRPLDPFEISNRDAPEAIQMYVMGIGHKKSCP